MIERLETELALFATVDHVAAGLGEIEVSLESVREDIAEQVADVREEATNIKSVLETHVEDYNGTIIDVTETLEKLEMGESMGAVVGKVEELEERLTALMEDIGASFGKVQTTIDTEIGTTEALAVALEEVDKKVTEK